MWYSRFVVDTACSPGPAMNPGYRRSATSDASPKHSKQILSTFDLSSFDECHSFWWQRKKFGIFFFCLFGIVRISIRTCSIIFLFTIYCRCSPLFVCSGFFFGHLSRKTARAHMLRSIKTGRGLFSRKYFQRLRRFLLTFHLSGN